ncbi:MAG: class I SAM-dependent methyltransferase, partial [Candidatus Omnitrophica bacterium]|nr:class I SAM-dependent methyltransferase [Candidatus Omnitrophota bacterium]
MDSCSRKEVWTPRHTFSLSEMNSRIKYTTHNHGWEEAIRILDGKGWATSSMKVAEIGSGTGTTSLTFALLGADTTLIDYNEGALEQSRAIYEMYGCKGTFIKEDCLNEPQDNIRGMFDLVISSGLLEHFTGNNRFRSLEFHRKLLKPGGLIFIIVPNSNSYWYQGMKWICQATGNWNIDIEVSFNARELEMLCAKAGLIDYHVIGYTGLLDDIRCYFLGFLVLLRDILPKAISGFLKKIQRFLYRGKVSSAGNL